MCAESVQHTPAVVDEGLPEDYYVRAFVLVLDSVMGNYADLLTPQEYAWIECIHGLPDPARRLYVRLLQRRSLTFRLSKLSYADVGDVSDAASLLVDAQLVSFEAPPTLAELANAYTLPELERLVPVTCPKGARRAVRIAALLERNSAADICTLRKADRWLRVAGHEVFAVCRLCFFGNLRQDMSEFVTTALGTQRYEPVPLHRKGRYFRDRAQLDAHLRYYECSALFEMLPRHSQDSLQELMEMLPEPVADDQHLVRRLDRLHIEMAKCFERLGNLVSARALYSVCCRPPARERLVRLLERSGFEDESQLLLTAMAEEPIDESEIDFARRRLQSSSKTAKPFRPRQTTLVLPETDKCVERACAEYFNRDGICHWVENRLFTSLLGLWIWDIVYLPVRGAFFNPFQSAPADFRERSFRTVREQEITARFAELDEPHAHERILDRMRYTLANSRGISNPLVSWDLAASQLVELAVERIPLTDLRAVFERILDHPSEHSSGLPDLVYFPSAGHYELIEVKGPGDALQANQRRWFRYFDKHNIPARVLKVNWTQRTPS